MEAAALAFLMSAPLSAAAPAGKPPASKPALPTESSKSVVVNGIAAEVAGKPITLEDVYFHRVLDKVKTGETGLLVLEKGEALKSSVQKLVLEEMVFGEMKSLNFDGGPKSEASRLLADRKKNAGFRPEWEKALSYFRIPDDKAVSMLWRSMQVDKFIEKKVETLTPLLPPDVVDRHLVTNTPGWTEMPEPKKNELRQRTDRLLKKERMGEQLRDWVIRLKRKYSVVQYL